MPSRQDTPPPALPAGVDPQLTRAGFSRRKMLGLAALGLGGVGAAQALRPAPASAAEDYADLTLSNLTDYDAARLHLGVAKVVTPEQFGAAGDGTTNDAKAIQKAIDAVAGAGGGMVWFGAHVYLIDETVLLRQGVTLFSGRQHKSLTLDNEGCILQAGPNVRGWLLDTTNNEWKLGLGIIGFNILGPGPHLPYAIGAIRLRICYGSRLQYLTINSFSDSCIRTEQYCVAISIEDCCIQTDSSGRELTAVCGSLDLHGSDHYIRSIQCNGGAADAAGTVGNLKVTYPGKFYRTGAHIVSHSTWIFDLNGEFGDVGIYIDTEAGSNGSNRYIATRADVNAGHGFYVDKSMNNQFVGCSAFFNGGAGPDLYDGAIHVNGASMNVWTNFAYHPVTLPLNLRYLWNDETTGNKSGEENTVDFPSASVAWMFRDLHNTKDPVSYALRAAGSGPTTRRLPSRYMAGGVWYDTTTNRPTYSDGASWHDVDGKPVGNLLTPDQATGRDEFKWEVVDDAATLTSVLPLIIPALQPNFNLPRVAELVTTAAASGHFTVRATTKFAVDHKLQYTLGARTMAGGPVAKVRAGVEWFDAQGHSLRTVWGDALTNSATELTIPLVRSRPPGNARTGRLLLEFARSGMGAGDKHYLNNAFATPADVEDYIAP